MISELIVKFAFWLHGSGRYEKVKTLFRDNLNDSNSRYKKYVDSLMIFLILTSVGILVYEVRNSVPEWMDFYDIYIVSILFFIEYILRLWVDSDGHTIIVNDYNECQFLHKPFVLSISMKKIFKHKISYMLSPSAIVDLLAILPAYRPLSILRIFVLFRVFKLLRYTRSISHFIDVLSSKRFELYTLLFLLVFIVFTAGIAIYVFEETSNSSIETLFDAFYWAMVTISTVGYGDISPVTDQGKAISMVIITSGIVIISFATSIIVSAFSEKLDELKENRIIEDVNKNKTFLVICGYGQLAKMFLRQEENMGTSYVVIDKDPMRVKQAIKDGYRAINDDASRYEVISKFNVSYSQVTVLCLTNSDVENIYIALNAKSLSRKIKVVARATNGDMKKKFELAGVDHIITPSGVANVMLNTAISQPAMYNAIYAILTGKDVANIDEIHTYECNKIIGLPISAIDFKSHKMLFLGIQRGVDGDFVFNPDKNIIIENDDILLVMGLKVSIEYFRQLYTGGVSV